MNCSPPGSSVLGISQARILEWVAISFSRALNHYTGEKENPEASKWITKVSNMVLCPHFVRAVLPPPGDQDQLLLPRQ